MSRHTEISWHAQGNAEVDVGAGRVAQLGYCPIEQEFLHFPSCRTVRSDRARSGATSDTDMKGFVRTHPKQLKAGRG